MRILSLDPGRRTGAALVHAPDDAAPVLVGYWEIPDGLEGLKQWWEVKPHYDVLVAEDFIAREGVHGIDYTPQRILGWLSDFDPVIQRPAGRKKAVSDDVLKRLGMYLAGERLRNAREAVRHAVVYLKHSGHKPTIRAGFISVDW